MIVHPTAFPHREVGVAIDRLIADPARRFESRTFAAHGRVVSFSTDDHLLAKLAHEILRAFPSGARDAAPDSRFCLSTSDRWSIPPGTEDLRGSAVVDPAAAERVRFSRLGGVNYFSLSPIGAVAYELSSAQALGFVADVETHRPWLISHYFVQSVVLELLRGLGLFWVHGASVVSSGRAALLVGESGSGKTTTALKLVDSGFELLSEDHTLLAPHGDALDLFGFVADVAVTDETVGMLPWLRNRLPEQPWGRKLRIDPHELLAGRIVERATPGVVLFVRVSGAKESDVVPLTAADALRRLLPNSLLASQPDVATLHLDALTRLVSVSKCYTLGLGRNIDALPELVGNLLANATGTQATG